MPRDGVDRLDLAAVPLGRPHVDEDLVRAPSLDRLAVERPRPTTRQLKEGGGLGLAPGLQSATGSHPGLDAAIEQSDILMAERVEHPPEACCDRASRVVVDDDRVVVPEAKLAESLG